MREQSEFYNLPSIQKGTWSDAQELSSHWLTDMITLPLPFVLYSLFLARLWFIEGKIAYSSDLNSIDKNPSVLDLGLFNLKSMPNN